MSGSSGDAAPKLKARLAARRLQHEKFSATLRRRRSPAQREQLLAQVVASMAA